MPLSNYRNFQLCILISEGRRHDAGILADSNLLDRLEQPAYSTNGQPLCLYGDPAYPLRIHLHVPFRQNGLTPEMEAFNASMSTIRESVEWNFGEVVRSFKALDFKNNLNLELSSVGKMYLVSSLIQNAITCLYGIKQLNFFNLSLQPCKSTLTKSTRKATTTNLYNYFQEGGYFKINNAFQ